MSVLSLAGVDVHRGEARVVHDVSLEAEAGAVTVVLGSNGSGKSTLMDGVAGLARVSSGTIHLGGGPIGKLPAYKRARAGLGYVEQSRTVFRTLSVEQNLRVARSGEGDLNAVYRLFPELERRRSLQAGHLSGGEQQMLALGRALVADPRVMLIDEMSMGLAPVVVRRLMLAVREMTGLGIAILLVEQFAALALEIGTRAYVLRKGRVVYSGACARLKDDDGLLHESYFGTAPPPGEGEPA
ncbi:ABC transporter ATP-binding protein [Nonomuraea typhae]|uniref:ABC transporter ATP-binding protein n=1 Tax=Nonomuraea typhae TaxID=2603600 RepID=UPI0012FB098B|nr:ABC transporter ATP-binding protein [Nonomuraea typhae]